MKSAAEFNVQDEVSDGNTSSARSGVPAAAFLNKSDNVVKAPSVTFLQKSGPSAALKVIGSHSSKATICTSRGECASAGSFRCRNGGCTFGCILAAECPEFVTYFVP